MLYIIPMIYDTWKYAVVHVVKATTVLYNDSMAARYTLPENA